MVRNREFGAERSSQVKTMRRRRANWANRLILRPEMEALEVRITPATRTWSGAVNNLWSNAGNWDVAPSNGDDLVFPSGATNFVTVDNLPGLVINSISIQDSQYQFVSTFVTPAAITNGVTATYPSGTASIGMNIGLGGGTVSVGSGARLDIDAAISGGSGLTFSGGGTLSLGGTDNNSYTGGTTVNAGTLLLSKTVSGTVAIPAGTFTIGNGVGTDLAQFQNSGNQIDDAANIVVNGTAATLDLNGFSDSIGGLTMTAGSVTTGAGTLTLGGNVTTNSAAATASISGNLNLGGATRTFTVNDSAAVDPDLSITANIGGTGAGITKAGANSRMSLAGNNTYDGLTSVNQGILSIAGANALGAITAGTTVTSGAVLGLGAGLALPAEPITLNGAGFGGLGALWSAAGASSIPGPVTLGSDSTIRVDATSLLTISGQISDAAGTFGLTKSGVGALTLTNANPYDGVTNVNGGVLAVTNAGALGTGAAAVASGAELDVSNNLTIANAITISGTGVGGNGALRSLAGANTVTGGVTLGADPTAIGVDAASALTVSGIGVGGGSNDLSKVGGGTLSLNAGAVGGYSGDLSVNGGRLDVNAAYGASIATANSGGTLGGTGLVGATTANSGGTIAPGLAAGTGILNTAALVIGGGSTFAVDLNGTTVGTQYDQLAVTGLVTIISGATLSVNLGFTPSVGNTFTIINNDTLIDPVIGTFAGLPQGATITLGAADLQISYTGGDGNDVVLTVTSVTFTWDGGGGDNNWNTAANWVGDILPTAGSNLIFPAGAARLSNTNNFAANTNFNNITVTGAGYILGGNAINLTGNLAATYAAGASTIGLDTALQSSRTVDVAAGGTLVLSGAISGAGFGVTKNGGGTLQYAGATANTYTGVTTVNAGTLALNKTAGTDAIAGSVVVGDNVAGGELLQMLASNQIANPTTVTVNEGATFDLNGFNEQFNVLVLQGSSVSIPVGSVLTVATGITSNVTANNVTALISGAGALDLNGNAAFAFNIADDTDIPVDARISAVVQNGGFTKLGAGVLALAGANTYTGITSVSAGAIQAESNAALGTTAAGTSVASGASVFFSGVGLSTAENFNIAGIGVPGAAALAALVGDATLTGNVNLGANSRIGAGAGATLTINGVLDDVATPFNLEVASDITGRAVLGGNNVAFAGNINVTGGFLRATSNNALGDPAVASTVSVQTNATLELTGGITIPATKTFNISGVPATGSSKIMSIAGNNAIQGNIAITGGNNVSIDVASATTLTVATISGARDIDKNGLGTLILTGASTHIGAVNALAGTLLVNGSIATSAQVNVGGVLGGTGTVPGVTVLPGGTLAPGTSPGILNAGNTSLGSASTFSVEINGTTVGTQYDQLNVTGTVGLGGSTLAVSSGFTAPAGAIFTIINNDGGEAVTGTFNGLAEGTTFIAGVNTFRISYIGGSGNDVTLTAVGTPTIALTAAPNPSVFGQSVTFGVTVSGSGVTPTGTVQFLADGNPIGAPQTLSGAGTASISFSALAVGSHVITANYSGDVAYSPGTGTLSPNQVVNKANSTFTTFTSAPNPSVFGQGVTFTAVVGAVAPGAGTPTGTVDFFEGATLLGTGTLSGGTATFTTSALSTGTHPGITAVYSGDGNFNGQTSGPITQNVFQAATSVVLTASPTQPPGTLFGQSVTFTATLAVIPPGAGTPTGTISFLDGATVISTQPFTGTGPYVATFTTSALSAATHPISAIYNGDANFSSSTSSVINYVVGPAVTATTVVASPASPSVFGQNVTFTATVANTSSSPVPTGSVQFVIDGGPVGAPVAVDGAGQAVLNTSSLAVGSHTVSAVYTSSTANFTNSSGALAAPYVVNKADVLVTTTTAPPAPYFGQTVTFSTVVSAVAPGAGTPGGGITLKEGAATIGTGTYTGGTLNIGVSTLSVGTHVIDVFYTDTTGNFNDNATQVTVIVVKAPTTTSIVLDSPDPSSFHQTVTIVGLVLSPSSGPITGNVELYDGDPNSGGVLLGTSPVTPLSIGVFTIDTLSVGTHALYAKYTGDANFDPSTSGPESHTVNPAATTTTLVSGAPNPSVYGQNVTFTASVAGAYGGTPTGTVEFYDGAVIPANLIGTGTLSGGLTTFNTSTLAVGSHSITAVYLTDGSFAGSTSSATTQTVNKANTTGQLSSTLNPSLYGQGVAFTYTATATPPGAGIPGGTVQFYVDAAPYGSPIALVSGVATTPALANLSVGSHSVLGIYSGDGNFNGGSASMFQTVLQGSTATAVNTSLNPSIYGDSVTFTATILVIAPAAGTPTGSVIFYDGATPIGAGAVGGTGPYTATFTTSTLTAGTHPITAQYLGDTNFQGSSSLAISQVVDKAATSIVATSSPNPSVFGQNVTFSATVSAVGSVPTGTVAFFEGLTFLGIDTLDSNGDAAISTAILSVGSHTITAVYSGDANHLGQTTTTPQVVDKADVTAALSSDINPSLIGELVTFTVTVSAAGDLPIPTGLVEFFDGMDSLGTAMLDIFGQASISTSALSLGGHSISVQYAGDGNYNPAADNLVQTVIQGTTNTTLDPSSVNPSTFGQNVTFTAVVSVNSPASGTPTGLVQFYDDGVPIGMGTVGGTGPFTATFTTSALVVGSHSISAIYLGDTNFQGSGTDSPITQDVEPAGTAVVGSSSPNPSALGQTTILTAAVTAEYGTVPTGTVTFYDGSTVLGIGVVDGSGVATISTVFFALGSHTIDADYSGDANHFPSTTAFTHDVTGAITTTTLSSAPNPSSFGQTVTFNVNVSATFGTPTGIVEFYDGAIIPANLIGQSTLFGGATSFSTFSLSVGAHPITAVYVGTPSFLPSTSNTVTQVVNPTATTTALTSFSANPSVWGQNVIFVATVASSNDGKYFPTGLVEFRDAGVPIGIGMLDAFGAATFATSNLEVATHPITAAYLGDGGFIPSTSGVYTQVVNKANSTTAIASSVNPSSFGQTVTFTATMTANSPGAGTPGGTVQFYADGIPIGGPVPVIAGQASVSKSNLSVAKHTITAQYLGDVHFNGSSRFLIQGVFPGFGPLVVRSATARSNVPAGAAPSGLPSFGFMSSSALPKAPIVETPRATTPLVFDPALTPASVAVRNTARYAPKAPAGPMFRRGL